MTAPALELRQVIAGPGIYPDMPDAVYHSDPTPEGSLSRTGAGKILPPKTPAHFREWVDKGEAPKATFNFGHAAHSVALGRGLKVRVVQADSWRTKDAKDERAAAYEAGEAPILAAEWVTVQAMAAALKEHPFAAAMLNASGSSAEVSLFWQDERTGVMLRSRPDLVRPFGRRFVIADYKTADEADDESFGKSSANYGYHLQQWFCCEGVRRLGWHPDPEMVFIVQEKTPPYLVNVLQLDEAARELGRRKAHQAIAIYAACQKAGRWPGYGDGVTLASLPRWATYGEDLPL